MTSFSLLYSAPSFSSVVGFQVLQLSAAFPLLRINSSFLFNRLLRLAVLQINTSTPTPPSHASLSLSSRSCCFSHQAGGSFQVFEQCSVACRVAVLSHVRQKQSASRRGMKGNGAVQPLLFTMGNILSQVVEQIAASSFIFFNVCLFFCGRRAGLCMGWQT